MKNHSFILKIEKPCSENWNAMRSNDAGKFCFHCQKNVIDFSTCSDDEVIRILEKIDGKTCGRLSKSQLERIYIVAKNKKASPRLNKILAGLFAMGMLKSPDMHAQNGNKENLVLQDNHLSSNKHEQHEKTDAVKMPGDSTKNSIHGKVIDNSSKTPISYFRVSIKNSSVVAITDTAGNFKIHVPDSLMSDSITLQLVQVGYEMAETKISRNNLSHPITLTAQQEEMMMGEMIYTPPPKKKKAKNK